MTIPKPGDELTLRNGWPAKVLAVHPEQDRAIFVEYLAPNGVWDPGTRLANGRNFKDYESGLDLMLPEPEPKQLCGWVNVYKKYNSCIHATRDEADAARDEDCLACLYIDIPYEEGGGI